MAGLVDWLRSLFGGDAVVAPAASAVGLAPAEAPGQHREDQTRYVLRGGRSMRAGPVFDAWTSGDLQEMLAAVNLPAHAVDRHHLLNAIVAETYRLRSEPTRAMQCEQFSELYLAERPALWSTLMSEWRGQALRIPVYDIYTKLLASQRRFTRAIEVCDMALALGLRDGTKSGFDGRRLRLLKAAKSDGKAG